MADTTDTTVPSVTIPADIDDATFHADVAYLESLWLRVPAGAIDLPIIDIGEGVPIVFVPILEHLEFVYARQVRVLSQSRRVILYRRREDRRRFVGLTERVEELRNVLDALGLQQADLVGHGDAAMVLLEFAAMYPQRCRSLVIVAQAADYQIAPHPFIWLLHELFLRLPVEHILPAWFLRRIVVNYIVASQPALTGVPGRPRPDVPGRPRGSPLPYTQQKQTEHSYRVGATLAVALDGTLTLTPASNAFAMKLPRRLIEGQFEKIALWPSVYKFSVLPIIHSFDMRSRVGELTMPILLINRADDVLAPEAKTRWLAEHLPNCAGYHLVTGHERFFMYSQAEEVNRLMKAFYEIT